jgi:hypothetical protein
MRRRVGPAGSTQDTRRRFEQWARNPRCTANAVSAILNIPMADVAKREGARSPTGQSPFALARGQGFERAIFRDDAKTLRDELESSGVLPTGSSGFADFRMKRGGGPFNSIDNALDATIAWLDRVAAGTSRECIAAGTTIRIPGGVMLPEATLCIDALAVDRSDRVPRLVVGEIKVYPDRGGYTDPVQLSTSRAQAGMYVHGLRLVVEELGLAERLRVHDRGFLVLSRSGTNRIRVRANEDLAGQAERARLGLAALSDTAQSMNLRNGLSLDVVQQANVRYCETCLSFCERAEICRERARTAGEGSILGDEVQRFLGEVSLARVAELARGAKPRDRHEAEILRLLASAEGRDDE